MNLTELEDANGKCHVDLTCVQAISGPMLAKYNPESRKVVLACGYCLYILNNSENCAKLGIPFDVLEDKDDDEDAPKPKRKRRTVPPWVRRAPKAAE